MESIKDLTLTNGPLNGMFNSRVKRLNRMFKTFIASCTDVGHLIHTYMYVTSVKALECICVMRQTKTIALLTESPVM